MTTPGKRLVLADRAGPSRAGLAHAARAAGFTVEEADDGAGALAFLDRGTADLLVVDVASPAIGGIALLDTIAARGDRVRVVLAGDAESPELATAEDLARQGGIDVVGLLRKPIVPTDLAALLRLVGPASVHLRHGELEHAIREGEIEAHYQPKYALIDGHLSLMGAEALARWRHPRLGLLEPSMFFDELEAGGLEYALTERMLGEATALAARCRDRGHHLEFAVNVTPALVSDPTWPDRIEHYLELHDLPPRCLALEITEGSMIHHALRSFDVLSRLRVRGIPLLLDDFGAGYSSLMRLHVLPFSEIKIDRTFIAGMLEQVSARTIVAAIIDLAHKLGLTACAEGVESQEAVVALDAMGCDYLQGYHLGVTVDGAAFMHLLARRAPPGSVSAPQG